MVPGRWLQEFRLIDPPPGSKRLHMACSLIVTLPIDEDGPDLDGVYEHVGELDPGSRASLRCVTRWRLCEQCRRGWWSSLGRQSWSLGCPK